METSQRFDEMAQKNKIKLYCHTFKFKFTNHDMEIIHNKCSKMARKYLEINCVLVSITNFSSEIDFIWIFW
jgi:hypothetical protein